MFGTSLTFAIYFSFFIDLVLNLQIYFMIHVPQLDSKRIPQYCEMNATETYVYVSLLDLILFNDAFSFSTGSSLVVKG